MGQLPVSLVNLSYFDTANRMVPCEGPRAVPISLDFSLGDTYYVNIQDIAALKRFTMLQALYLDNAGNPTPLIVTCVSTGQRIIMGSGMQGYRNVLCPNPGQVNFVSESGATIKVHLLNFPVIDSEWSTT
jgi:hypothetical protein